MRGNSRFRSNQGQALVMVTLALVVMFGMLGLAVDLGWAFFIEKTAQNAADAASLAAAHEALLRNGPGYFSCDAGISECVPNPVPCDTISSSSNLHFACQYAQENGFVQGGKNGRQVVTVAADISSPPPTLAGDPKRQVQVYYWVTVRIREQVPQLFSAVLGNMMGNVSSRATAAVADTIITGSLILINRINDPSLYPGEDFVGIGGPDVVAEGPILLASTAAGPDQNDEWAGNFGAGGGTVTAPRTDIRGGYFIKDPDDWQATPNTGVPDSKWFHDPFEGKGQPPPPDSASFNVGDPSLVKGIPFGSITGGDTAAEAVPLQPGFYFATDAEGVATGEPLRVTGHVDFTNEGSDFGEYVFFGGMDITQPETVATFDSGRYVFAGVLEGNRVLNTTNKTKMLDNSTPWFEPTDAGEIFIFTDPKFLNEANQIPDAIRDQPGLLDQLGFGDMYVLAGEDTSSLIGLHGLNKDHGSLPADLKDFAPVVFWQDQRNSSVKYVTYEDDPALQADHLGEVDVYSCGGATYETPCYNDTESGNKWDHRHYMELHAGSNMAMWGAIYQPRGAWVHIQANDDYDGPIQIVSGGLSIRGTPRLTLRGLDNPITIKTIALVE